jgi:hypothetical protein
VRAAAVAIAHAGWARLHRDGGWFREPRPLLAGIGPQAVVADGHVPSPSALLIGTSLELGDPRLRALARDALAAGGWPPRGAATHWATHTWVLAREAARGAPG